jgi:uroporphyrinogen-III decarboxylase
MTSRERILSVYRGEAVDGIPVVIYARYLPRGSVERELRSCGLGILDYVPPVTLLAPPWHTHAGYVSRVNGADLEIRWTWDNGVRVEIRTYRTPVGTVSQRTSVDPSYGSDWIGKHYIETLEDYKTVQYLVENTVFRDNRAAVETRRRDLGSDGVVLARLDRSPFQKLLIELAGPERFLLDLHTDPEPVVELLDCMARKTEETFQMVVDSAADAVWQPDNVTSELTPPRYFEKFCLPLYESRARLSRQAGKAYLVHMDGKLKALKALIARSSITGIESFSVPLAGGDLPLVEARSAWPGKLLLPNFPASLCYQPEEAIQGFLDGLLDDAGRGTPSLLQFSEDIPPSEWQRVVGLVCRYMTSRPR